MTTINIDYRSTFLDQWEALQRFPMFQRMARTVEASPWHREANVLVHTEMVIRQYMNIVDDNCDHFSEPWTRADYLGAIAAAFHDTGKPAAEIEKFSEARGTYRAYHGHELLSARLFETYAAERFPLFSGEDIFKVCWMIENHMPWQIEDRYKLESMAKTAKWIGAQAFCNELLADQYGRIADDQVAKNQAAYAWVEKFMSIVNQVQHQPQHGAPTMWMPIAPSGAGKSTFLRNLIAERPDRNIQVFSLDLLRHEFYHPTDYTEAYQQSVDDKSFEAKANMRFRQMMQQCVSMGHDIYIDNVNLSPRRRRFYLDAARKSGFCTIAVTMPVSLDVILERQKTRGDKTVPSTAVIQQYKSLHLPMLGEFDEIIVSEHNLKCR